MEFVDTHCHLNHPDFEGEAGVAVRRRAWDVGVRRLLCIGYDEASSRRAVALSEEEGVFAAVGIHPESAGEWGGELAERLREMWHSPRSRVVAWGEIGLDYHWETIPRDRQQAVFLEQIAFARALSPTLPLIIHCRDAFDDVLTVLAESGTPAPVVMHCFTGDTGAARRVLDAGYYLGIGGVATFKKADALREAIALAPLERLLLETDCPYLAPQPWRGKRNEPSYLPAVAQTVAAVKGIRVEEVAAVTTATAMGLFGMEELRPTPAS